VFRCTERERGDLSTQFNLNDVFIFYHFKFAT